MYLALFCMCFHYDLLNGDEVIRKNLPDGTLGPEGYWQYDIAAEHGIRASILI